MKDKKTEKYRQANNVLQEVKKLIYKFNYQDYSVNYNNNNNNNNTTTYKAP